MNLASPQELIDTAELRIGMFVHLEGGWLSHPFALSHFKIDSAEQIRKIRELGLEQVRWSPQESDVPAEAVAADPAPAAPAPDIEPVPPPLTAEEAERAQRKRALAAQREALARCERQFAEASIDLRRATDLVAMVPEQARKQTEQLTQALLAKMLVADETCIALLSDGVGDKATTHPLNVSVLALLVGRACGLPETDLQDLGVGALLHDVGKIDVAERVRQRAERFTPSELRAYEEHVGFGVARARRMGLSAGATAVIAQHHELADGSGFPNRIGVDRMSIAARIVALVNRYDRLCNPHFATKSLTPHEALASLFAQERQRFDSAILNAFIRMLGVYPPGSAVQLTDDRFALVTNVNAARPLKPVVLVYDPQVPSEDALTFDLGTDPKLGIRRSLNPLQLPAEVLQYLRPRQRVAYFFEPARDADPA